MLCVEQRNDEGVLISVGPGSATSGCVATASCCGRSVKLQIRSRMGYGGAVLCAAFIEFSSGADDDVWYTQKSYSATYRRYNGETQIGTCKVTIDSVSGDSAIKTFGAEGAPDCNGESADENWIPLHCNETMNDPPATHVIMDTPVLLFTGDSGSKEDTKDAAEGALAWGDWSEWSTLLDIPVDGGNPAAAGLSHILAVASAGTSGSSLPFYADVFQMESELRVVGDYDLQVTVSQGSGDPSEMPLSRHILSKDGTAHLYSVAAASFSEDWVPELAMLRCACSLKYASGA